jgi:hypothetical protein
MIDPIQSASIAGAGRLAPTTTPAARSTTASGGSFAGQLARLVSTAPDGAVKAATRPDNEQTKKVSGHPYSRVENGADKGRYLNQVDGSPREGAVFRRVERDDRVLHVYGTGKDKVIVAIMTDKTKDKDADASPTGGATPATT